MVPRRSKILCHRLYVCPFILEKIFFTFKTKLIEDTYKEKETKRKKKQNVLIYLIWETSGVL